jgi:hypothetical protein
VRCRFLLSIFDLTDAPLGSDFLRAAENEARNSPTGNIDQVESKGERWNTGEAQAQEVGLEAPRRGRKRGAATETLKLIQSRLQLSPEKGRAEWKAISDQIPGRNPKQCRHRWDTVVRPYKKIKRHCDAHGKHFNQVTEEEFRSMNVDWRYWRDNKWYRMIDEYHLRLSCGK